MISFSIKWRKRCVFFAPISIAVEAGPAGAAQENAFVLNFSYVCPKPVLVN
jgi:hypothetical protein